MPGHGACYLVANGEDGNRYYAYCSKYRDEYETSFKAEVKARTGFSCRRVQRMNTEPSGDNTVEIEL